MLQCGAVCCSVVQCGAVWCSVVQCGAVKMQWIQSESRSCAIGTTIKNEDTTRQMLIYTRHSGKEKTGRNENARPKYHLQNRLGNSRSLSVLQCEPTTVD